MNTSGTIKPSERTARPNNFTVRVASTSATEADEGIVSTHKTETGLPHPPALHVLCPDLVIALHTYLRAQSGAKEDGEVKTSPLCRIILLSQGCAGTGEATSSPRQHMVTSFTWQRSRDICARVRSVSMEEAWFPINCEAIKVNASDVYMYPS